MMPPILNVYGRLPAMTPTQATLALRAASSHNTPDLKNLTTIQHHLHHRTLHTSPPHQRRPPPIRISKTQPPPPEPKPKPKSSFPLKPEPTPNQEMQHYLVKTLRSTADAAHQRQKQQDQKHPKTPLGRFRRRLFGPITLPDLVFTALALLAVYWLPIGDGKKRRAPLNDKTFTPFAVTAREQLSPTAFVLTVESPADAKGAEADEEVVRGAWAHGLWSVEVKQPELMVARDYTPLPGEEGEGLVGKGGQEGEEGGERGEVVEKAEGGGGKLRFYVRKMEKGEVSGYLDRLKVGDKLELRGPRLGFDLRKRMGVDEDGNGEGDAGVEGPREKKKVVFLAGGTGIAPALQAARALLDKPEVEMEVVWANRRLEDCVGGEKQGPVVAMLEDFRKKYGDRFRYSCTVDEEGSFIDTNTIARLTAASSSATAPAPAPVPVPTPTPTSNQSTWGLWSTKATNQNTGTVSPPTPRTDSSACLYHSPKSLANFDDRDAPTGTASQRCRCKDADGHPVRGGKNLLMVSGPEGFIAHFAGAKVWDAGIEMQGPVNGVIGELKRKNPALGEDWLVLKL